MDPDETEACLLYLIFWFFEKILLTEFGLFHDLLIFVSLQFLVQGHKKQVCTTVCERKFHGNIRFFKSATYK